MCPQNRCPHLPQLLTLQIFTTTGDMLTVIPTEFHVTVKYTEDMPNRIFVSPTAGKTDKSKSISSLNKDNHITISFTNNSLNYLYNISKRFSKYTIIQISVLEIFRNA